MDIEILADAVLTVRGDRMELPPPGRDGGHDGTPGYHRIRHADGTVDELRSKQVNIPLRAGDHFVLGTSGGGGLGDPALRERSLVAEDVRVGRVSAAAAGDLYGWTPHHEEDAW
jgi:N-methylhydantoinase B